MKKILITICSLAIVFVSVFGFVGCANDKESDTFIVAMECAYEPFNWTQADNSNGAVEISGVQGKYANGYDVQVAKIIAEKLGKKLVIVQAEWDSLIPGVQLGTYDAIIAGMSPTTTRREEVDFSDYYYTSNLVVITKSESSLATASTLSDIDVSGYKIAAQPGTSHLDLLRDQTSNCTVIDNLEDFPAMKIALEAGTIDGYIAEKPTAMALTSTTSGFTYVDLVNNSTGFTTDSNDTSISVGVKKGNSYLQKINEAINSITEEQRAALMQQMVNLKNTIG